MRALTSLICLFVTGAVPRVLGADVVHLTNGRAMEGVVLEETSEQITLQLPFGEIRLPRSSVRLVEPGRSSLQEYLERRLELEQGHGKASDWVELALWAEREGLDHSARESTLVAARLEPGLPGLVPLMTDLGYEYEENLAVWLPYEELMRRRGYVLSNGRWLSADQAAALRRAQEEEAASAFERQRQDRLARAMEIMVLVQMAQAEESRRLREEVAVPRYGLPLWGGYPVGVVPGSWPRRPDHDRRGDGSHHSESSSHRAYREAIVSRPPGSLIPVRPVEGHRGGFQQPPGTP